MERRSSTLLFLEREQEVEERDTPFSEHDYSSPHVGAYGCFRWVAP